VSLPRFHSRVIDAAVPVLGGLDREAVRRRLECASVNLIAGDVPAGSPQAKGFMLATNLAARLYPRIHVSGPGNLVADATATITRINPLAEVADVLDEHAPSLLYETNTAVEAAVLVAARSWNIYVDQDPDDDCTPPTAPAAMLAAVIGVGELFRSVFAAELADRGRTGPTPAAFSMVTLGEPTVLPTATHVALGEFRLVGCGAIGQAAAGTLAASEAQGTMIAVDHELVSLSNLQRYLLTDDSDVHVAKVDLLRDRLSGSGIDVVPVQSEWHAALARELRPTLVALDSAQARVAVQSSLPGRIYNAWTQPADVGWSRHEEFGTGPCLACLYWPDRPVPSQHEQIAASFRQHPLRILTYLVQQDLTVGVPIQPGGVAVLPGLEVPPDMVQHWTTTPLLDDLALAAGVPSRDLAAWGNRRLVDVYQEGICGGALLHLSVGDAPREVLVPLAHQSALAGIMLATELLVASIPDLRAARCSAPEARYDVLAAPGQVMQRPRARTESCLCADVVFTDTHSRKVSGSATPRDRQRQV
jgi:hypothetical protein